MDPEGALERLAHVGQRTVTTSLAAAVTGGGRGAGIDSMDVAGSPGSRSRTRRRSASRCTARRVSSCGTMPSSTRKTPSSNVPGPTCGVPASMAARAACFSAAAPAEPSGGEPAGSSAPGPTRSSTSRAHLRVGHAELAEGGGGVRRLQTREGEQQVLGLDLGVPQPSGLARRGGHHLLAGGTERLGYCAHARTSLSSTRSST